MKKILFIATSMFAIALMFFAGTGKALAYTHTVTLKLGSRGSQVMELQQTLNQHGFVLATVGAGSPGFETTYFGPITRAAVIRFQIAHPEVGAADGIVGPRTGGALAALTGTTSGTTCPAGYVCTPTTPVPCPIGYVCTPVGNNNNGTLSGGETSISNFQVTNANNDTIGEDTAKAELAQVRFRVKDADAKLTRADFVLDAGAVGSGAGTNTVTQPWKVFNKVYLLDDSGNVLASTSSTSSSDWEETSTSNTYRIRLSDINKVFKSGDTYTLHLAADIAGSVKGSDVSGNAHWNVYIPANGFRFTDGAGVETTVPDTDSSKPTFDIQTAGQNSQLTVTEDSSSPAAGNINTDTSNSTTETVAVFKLKANQSGGNIKIDDFPVTIKLQSAGSGKLFSDVISDVYLKINGKTYTGTPASTLSSVTANGTSSVLFNFPDIKNDNVTVSAGDSTTATVQVKFRSQGTNAANYANGTTVTAATALTMNSDFEDAASGDNIGTMSPNSGTVTAHDMGLYSTGIQAAVVSTNTSVTAGSGTNDDIATYTIKFTVTAFGNTVYIPTIASTTASNAVNFTVDKAGTPVTSGVSGVIVDNTDSHVTANGNYDVPEGSSETFTLTVSASDATNGAGLYRAALSNIRWNTDDSTTYNSYTTNLDKFRTDYVALN